MYVFLNFKDLLLHVCVYCTAIPVPGGGGGGSGRNKLILNTLKKNYEGK